MQVDHGSATWLTVRDYCERRIAGYRDELEDDLDPVETAKVRRAIRELRDLLQELGPDRDSTEGLQSPDYTRG
jgi:hypothetical protein